jgi:hypothetical protein
MSEIENVHEALFEQCELLEKQDNLGTFSVVTEAKGTEGLSFINEELVEDRIVVKYNLRNMCRIYVSLIMSTVSAPAQYISQFTLLRIIGLVFYIW